MEGLKDQGRCFGIVNWKDEVLKESQKVGWPKLGCSAAKTGSVRGLDGLNLLED